jgi:hypothetical protein
MMQKWLPLMEAFEAGAWVLHITADTIFVSVIPSALHLDDRRRLHCDAGPAFAWLDDVRDYYWHGVHVPKLVVMRPQEITVAMIDAEANAEVRRVMIERYRLGEEIHGAGAFMRDAGGKALDHDERFGTLWHRAIKDDEPIVILEVINSTREPDGHFKHYWLRVHPELRPLPDGDWDAGRKQEWLTKQKPQKPTALAAAASLHGLRAEEYAPLIET